MSPPSPHTLHTSVCTPYIPPPPSSLLLPTIKMVFETPQLYLSRFSCAETDTEIDTNTKK